MTSTRPDDLRLYELFVRYWDNTLSHEEAAELEKRLTADEQARDWFQLFTLQTVAAADLPAMTPVPESSRDRTPEPPETVLATPKPARNPRLTRRRMMQFVGGGLAAGVGGAAMGWWLWPDGTPPGPRLRNLQGTVIVQDMSGKAVSPDSPIPPGGTVSTYGLASSVVVAYPDAQV